MYKGLVTVLMRSVFVLFAEEQNLLPIDRELYAGSYSLTRLYAQLVEDLDRYGDTSEDRYGGTDILPAYDFREQLDESTRLTWAEDTRDEVLARLLELNRVMAAREA